MAFQKHFKSRRTCFSFNITLGLFEDILITAKILLCVPFEKHEKLCRRQVINAISLSAFTCIDLTNKVSYVLILSES